MVQSNLLRTEIYLISVLFLFSHQIIECLILQGVAIVLYRERWIFVLDINEGQLI
jgi:hypothetical protein